MENTNYDALLARGIKTQPASEKAPEFIISNTSINVEPFIKFLRDNVNAAGYVNLVNKISKSGNHYSSLDSFFHDDSKAPVKAAVPVADKAPAEPAVREGVEEMFEKAFGSEKDF